MQELLKIDGLTVRFYTYEGVVLALDNLDLAVGQQETLGLVGETGCGKTMTALSILRLIPPPGKIESGSILFNADGDSEAVDLLKISEAEMRAVRGSQISMIFQEPSAALNPVFTIGEQIAEVILLHRHQEMVREALKTVTKLLDEGSTSLRVVFRPAWVMEKSLYHHMDQKPETTLPRILGRIPLLRRILWRIEDEARKTAVTMLKQVEIPDAERVARQHPHQLSGGMKQRCVIAMALSCQPRFLIADEPTTSLDVTVQAQILELLRRLKVDRKSSILYITHDLAVAAEICDRIGVMYAGSMCELAQTADLFAEPLHPYTRALLAAVPKPGEEPHSIPGFIPDPLSFPPGCRFHPRCDVRIEACAKEVPPLREVKPRHFVACHVCSGVNSGQPA
ncbi:MAG: ABC transporter ATP-binding protein [Dehalococcoidia bacterium]|nr:ABC transporter ATP-binding protein [Dehalococcoidia bacterium]